MLFPKLCVGAQSLQLCPTLCNPTDCSPPGSSVHGIPRQESWSGLSCPPPGDLLDPGIEPTSLMSPALAGGFFTTSATWETSLDQGLTGSVWPTGHTFVAAVSLQFSGAHSLMDHLWQLLHYNSKLKQLQQT